MDFFTSQDVARKKTGRLVFFFALAVLGTVTAVYFLVVSILVGTKNIQSAWAPEVMLLVALGTVGIIGLGSLIKMIELRAGGAAVAEAVGARLVAPGSTDLVKRRLLNVVEEMAIASGTPVPPVYMLEEEEGINAFAAGYKPDSAVIAVTRGCAERLTRDQLQGVVAHEFSHILNGDMRLNIRLIGLLAGILLITQIGYQTMRSLRHVRGGSGKNKGGGMAAILAIGLGLVIIGAIGTLFGQLIKAAVSRQREYLADASAVQFTRHPEGIGGALKAIGGWVQGGAVDSAKASEVSHMFFAQGVKNFLGGAFATHPPLEDRIKRIDQSWDGLYPEVTCDRHGVAAEVASGIGGQAAMGLAGVQDVQARAGSSKAGSSKSTVVDQVGRPNQQHLNLAAKILQGLPEELAQAVRDSYSARAVVWALLIGKEPQSRQAGLEEVARDTDKGMEPLVRRLLGLTDSLDPRARLPLAELAAPTLCMLSGEQYQAFRGRVEALVKADNKMDLFEWALQRSLLSSLDGHFGRKGAPKTGARTLSALRGPAGQLLSTLAWAGGAKGAQAAFRKGAASLGLPNLEMIPANSCSLDGLDAALNHLVEATPPLKRRILEAAATCVIADENVNIQEAELLRAIAGALGCPMPPVI